MQNKDGKLQCRSQHIRQQQSLPLHIDRALGYLFVELHERTDDERYLILALNCAGVMQRRRR